jgi:hypothetical protein
LNSSAELAARPAVEDRRLKFIQDFLKSKDSNMNGSDMKTYDEPAGDIVALREEIYQDPVSAWIARKLYPWLKRICGLNSKGRKSGGIRKLSGTIIQVVGSILGAVSATGYLIAAIVTLYYTSSVLSRLGVIAAFSLGHAVLLCLLGSLSIESVNAISTQVIQTVSQNSVTYYLGQIRGD